MTNEYVYNIYVKNVNNSVKIKDQKIRLEKKYPICHFSINLGLLPKYNRYNCHVMYRENCYDNKSSYKFTLRLQPIN